MSKPAWMEYKYDLGDNGVFCDGEPIAYANPAMFDIKDSALFNAHLMKLALQIGWLVSRANLASEMYDLLVSMTELGKRDLTNPKYDSYFDEIKALIAKAENRK